MTSALRRCTVRTQAVGTRWGLVVVVASTVACSAASPDIATTVTGGSVALPTEPSAAPGVDAEPPPQSYHLMAVRDRNVVVVLETTGWAERASRTMEFALRRAVPTERNRCPEIAPCPDAQSTGLPEPGLLEVDTDPLMTGADWQTVTGQIVSRSDSAPTELVDCLTVDVGPARRVFSASYVESPALTPNLNEYVFQLDSVDEATALFARTRALFYACPETEAAGWPRTHSDTGPGDPDLSTYMPVDELLVLGGAFDR